MDYPPDWRTESRFATPDRHLRRALLGSVAGHGAVLLVLWLGLPVFLPPIAPPTQLVPIEIADVSAITNTRVKQQPQPIKQQPPPQQSKPTVEPTKPPKPVESASQQAQITPPTPPAPPEPEALPENPTEIKKPDIKKPEPKKPVEDNKPKPDPLASVLKNLAQIKPKSGPKTLKPTPKPDEDNDDVPDNDAPSLSDKLSISEEDALRRQIASCWNVPIGARNAEELVVQLHITVNSDRTVQDVQVVDRMRMATDSFFRAAAESAMRALRHPLCTPLALPPEKYDQWKVINFNFDPRDML